MTRFGRRLPLVVVALLALSSPAAADPFVVTGGQIWIPATFGPAHFDLEGDGFSLVGSVEQFVGSLTCAPCSANDSIRIAGPLSDISFGGRPGTFNGVDYPAIFFTGVMTLSSPPFAGSMLLDSPTVMLPFEFTGLLSGFHSAAEAIGPGVPIFSIADFTGAGIVSATFSTIPVAPGQTPLFDFSNATFGFTAALPEPTPEPATIALVAMGAGAALLRRRRR